MVFGCPKCYAQSMEYCAWPRDCHMGDDDGGECGRDPCDEFPFFEDDDYNLQIGSKRNVNGI